MASVSSLSPSRIARVSSTDKSLIKSVKSSNAFFVAVISLPVLLFYKSYSRKTKIHNPINDGAAIG